MGSKGWRGFEDWTPENAAPDDAGAEKLPRSTREWLRELEGPAGLENHGETLLDADVTRNRLEYAHVLEQPGCTPEQLPPEFVEAQMSWMRHDERAGRGHACVEHLDASDSELERRAKEGINARGLQEQQVPRHATRFTSKEALVMAEAKLWAEADHDLRHKLEAASQRQRMYESLTPGEQADYPQDLERLPMERMRLTARGRAEDVLGPGWKEHVYGRTKDSGGRLDTEFSADTEVFALWRMDPEEGWYLATCFPRPR